MPARQSISNGTELDMRLSDLEQRWEMAKRERALLRFPEFLLGGLLFVFGVLALTADLFERPYYAHLGDGTAIGATSIIVSLAGGAGYIVNGMYWWGHILRRTAKVASAGLFVLLAVGVGIAEPDAFFPFVCAAMAALSVWSLLGGD